MSIKYGANVLVEGHRCYRCKLEWRPKNLKLLPKVCPNCKNPYWETPVQREKTSKAVKKIRKEEKMRK